MKSTALQTKLTAVFEPAQGGFTCLFAELPEVFSEGETLEEAEANLLDALQLILECHRQEAGERASTPATVYKELQLVVGDWESLEETSYLRSSPANAQRLLESIHELESTGKGITKHDASVLLDS